MNGAISAYFAALCNLLHILSSVCYVSFCVIVSVLPSLSVHRTSLRCPDRLPAAIDNTMKTTLPAQQETRQTQGPKRKRGPLLAPHTSSPSTSTSFCSPNRFAVLSDSESEQDEPVFNQQTTDKPPRIPPIVLYSFLTNHSDTLRKVNSKLSSPVEVKTKNNRLLLFTKSAQDYNIVLSEIQTAKLEYHTYPLPDSTPIRLVPKGLPPNIPTEEIQTTLESLNINTIKRYQITKSDKSSHEILTK